MEQMLSMGNYGKVVQDAGNMERVPSAGKLMQGNSASEWWHLVKRLSMCYILCQMKNDFFQSIMVHFGKLVDQVLDGYQSCAVVLSY